ncbi:MAG TPA: translation initiation factor [Candidatus Marinimicrobia bacterium]|nr:translation initiation factor [Candidatus Neomarinimicrobiota bacterium]
MKQDKNTAIVFSTDPEFSESTGTEGQEEILNREQDLHIHLDRKGGGKVVTVIKGYRGIPRGLKELGKYLQSSCSTGGTVTNNEILIQGNFREKARDLLQVKGYRAKLSGG